MAQKTWAAGRRAMAEASAPIQKERTGDLRGKVCLYMEDSDYCGEELGTQLRCRHGLRPQRRVAWEGGDTGRRFLGCPMEEEEDCDFVQWVGAKWPARVQKTLEQMWDIIDRRNKKYEVQLAEEAKMKLELEMADRLDNLEMKYAIKVENMTIRSMWCLGVIVVLLVVLTSVLTDWMNQY